MHLDAYSDFPWLQKRVAPLVYFPLLRGISLSSQFSLVEKIVYSYFDSSLGIEFQYLFFFHLEKNAFHTLKKDNILQNLPSKIVQINALLALTLLNHSF